MPLFDLGLPELRSYRPDVAEPADFDEFWSATIGQARAVDLELTVRRADNALRRVESHDVTFAGFDGAPIKAWYSRPADVPAELPIVVQFVGYSHGRGLSHEHTLFPSAGFAHLVMDTRGQGFAGSGGDTTDPAGTPSSAPGLLTRGVDDPCEYYYRRVFTDAVRAVDAARELPGVDGDRLVVFGSSQGGGIAIAAAALADDVTGLVAHVPFLQHVRRAVDITAAAPYAEITRYLSVHRTQVETLWRTMSYFDGVNFAKRAGVPALYSVALMDQICPPSTVFASYNAYGERAGGPIDKQLEVWTYNTHEGGGEYQRATDLRWLADRLW